MSLAANVSRRYRVEIHTWQQEEVILVQQDNNSLNSGVRGRLSVEGIESVGVLQRLAEEIQHGDTVVVIGELELIQRQVQNQLVD